RLGRGQEPGNRLPRREQLRPHPDTRAALGRERQNTLLAEAEAARTARQARLYRRQAATPARRGSPPQCRAGIGAEVVLRDGSAGVLRPRSSEGKTTGGGLPQPRAPAGGRRRTSAAPPPPRR